MYLKEIIATGFKSFADKIDIKLDNRTTCIVGPNGSGKSNIVDAVRWVLGEQSVKSLRGDNLMSDVIFAGSKNRNAHNYASVEIIFDNSDKYLKVDYTDVSIKRRAYRTGENEYFLNNQKCRLKDIIDLMLDTGIGKESFNIISQGEVDKILSNSSFDRRMIVEEVAGVLKYKKRKEEALKKLDKTHDNMLRISDILLEVEKSVVPLQEQSNKASEYLDNKKKLEELEVALLAYDIYNDTKEVEQLKEKCRVIDEKILNLGSSALDDSNILKKNIERENLDSKLNSLNKELIEVLDNISSLNNDKLLLEEKQKNNVDMSKNEELFSKLIEEKEQLNTHITLIDSTIDDNNNLLKIKVEKKNSLNEKRQSLKTRRDYLVSDFSKLDQELISLAHKKRYINEEMENGSFIPKAVNILLKEESLTGIYNIIGNVLTTSDVYVKALDVAIASSKNFIIIEDEECSKKAIKYLKDRKLGRATFFPLSIIKSRRVDGSILKQISDSPGFIGVFSDLVKYDEKYKNVIENQLGNVLLCSDLDSAFILAKKINYKYKIVTLDGDVVNVFGSLSGGSSASYSKSLVTLKQELNFVLEKIRNLENEKEERQKEVDDVNKEISIVDDDILNINHDVVEINDKISKLKEDRISYNDSLNKVIRDSNSLDAIINNNVVKELEEITRKYYSEVARRDLLKKEIDTTSGLISSVKEEIEKLNADYKVSNQKLRELEKSKNELQLQREKLDINIDNMLRVLSEEYSMTYEKARDISHLDIDVDVARERVNLYRSNIKRIGMVNLDSIEEYERVNSRYQFLLKQKGDLESAETSLMEIMNDMDGVIIEEFEKTFNALNDEFKLVFRQLFSGGEAYLKLTDSDNLLTTGIDIVASPPGKKLTSINLLSGGEKTLTAISLLFAILNVRKIPFCLFDEVEAALDEANVEQFGKYLDNYKDKTQFLIITHKKKTMEYANTLYGITMQESGVSKLVSVKLNEHIDSL